MKRNIKLIIFDWSGVISDDRKPVYKTDMRVLRRYKKPLLTLEQWLENPSLNAQEFFSSQGICGTQDELFNL